MSVTVLDGGMGQELLRRSGRKPTPLWSTQVLMDEPELVQQVHANFFAAGAQIATTNTYALLPDRLEKYGGSDQFEALMARALDVAEAARDAAGSGQIAGSIGPLEASYRPDLCPAPEVAEKLYAGSVALLADRVDFFILETMSSVAQAEGALKAGCASGKPVWLAT